MPGMACPRCSELTFYRKGNKRICSKCGYTVTESPNEGKGGKGQRCPMCGKFTWFKGKCNACGAHEE